MANIKAVLLETFIAGEDLSDYQYYGVALTTTARTVDLVDADTDKPVGILQNDPESGYEAQVMVFGRTPIKLGETVAVGAQMRIDSNGKGMNWDAGTDTTAYCVGMCTIGGDANEVGEMIVWPANARGDC